jgi:hypothetical protein
VGAVHVPVTYTPPVVAGAFPDASTTGARGTFTNYTGNTTISSNGQTYSGLVFANDTTVTGSNNKFVNCKFTDQSYWPLRITGVGNVLDHCTFANGNNSQCSVDLGSGNTIQFCDVSGAGDGVHGENNCTVTDNFIHPTGPSDAHRDAIDIEGNSGGNVIRHNRIEVYSNQTSCITLENDAGGGKWDNNLVENNLLAGAGYVFYFVSKVPITNLVVRNNTFSKKFFPAYGYYGTVYQGFPTGAGNSWSGNVDADTGATINKP